MTQVRARTVTKSVRFSAEESELVEQMAQREHLTEGAFLRKLVLDSLEGRRVEHAIADYQTGVLNLGEAAMHAGIGTDRLLAELDRRGIDTIGPEHFWGGLQHLVSRFGGGEALRAALEEQAAGRGEPVEPLPRR